MMGKSEMAIAPTTIFVFEACAELFSAAFDPKPQRGAREDKSETRNAAV